MEMEIGLLQFFLALLPRRESTIGNYVEISLRVNFGYFISTFCRVTSSITCVR